MTLRAREDVETLLGRIENYLVGLTPVVQMLYAFPPEASPGRKHV